MSMYFGNRLNRFVMDEKKDDGGGGGGKPDPKPDPKDDVIAQLTKRLEALEKPRLPADDPDLQRKAKDQRDSDEKKANESKQLESAIRFGVGSKDWLKTNSSLMPSTIASIFETAEKEKYDSAIEKDKAIKASIVQEFFSLQDNLDLLTPGLKTTLEDFLKLTKNGKHDRAQSVFESVFEPTLEMVKRVKKADLLRKGEHEPTDSEDAYRKKLEKGSRVYYLGEKQNA